MEAAEYDAKLVKHSGQSFWFSAVEARKEEEVKAAHDKAMSGVPAARKSITPDHKLEGSYYSYYVEVLHFPAKKWIGGRTFHFLVWVIVLLLDWLADRWPTFFIGSF